MKNVTNVYESIWNQQITIIGIFLLKEMKDVKNVYVYSSWKSKWYSTMER